MGKGLGSVSGKTCKGLGLDKMDRPNSQRVKGINPKGDDAGKFGGARFPTVIEQYNRDSDYSRWRHGQQYSQGVGKSYADHSIALKARFLLGNQVHISRSVLSLFPSKTSADFSWVAARRIRGSVVSKIPFERSRITLSQNPQNPSEDRLIFRISEEFTEDEMLMKHLQLLIGDQIEDSFSGPRYEDRIGDANGSTALTLLDVDAESKTLIFDLSKPQGRVLSNGKLRWARLAYDPADPFIWREGLHLGTAIRYYCGCPDFSGTLTANTQSTDFDSTGRRFPVPSAQRTVGGEYEKEMVGFQKKWRDLPERSDQRRECKHIHCMRWTTKTPWFEPSDIPVGGQEEMIHAGSDIQKGDAFSEDAAKYQRNRVVDWQQTAQAACGAMGFSLDVAGDMANRTDRPQLWILKDAPMPEHCRQNDYWLERGTKNLSVYMAEGGGWVNTLKDEDGSDQPIISYGSEAELKELLDSA